MTVRTLILQTDAEPTDLSEQEKAAAATIRDNLLSMTFFANEATASVDLFEHVNALPHAWERHGWPIIPAKQLIVSLYNYRMAMDAVVTTSTRSSKTISRYVDTVRMEELKTQFRQNHPHTKELRQTILHTAELTATPERRRETSIKNPSAPFSINLSHGTPRSNMINGMLQMTFNGSAYFQPVTREIAEGITANCTAFILAFEALGMRPRIL